MPQGKRSQQKKQTDPYSAAAMSVGLIIAGGVMWAKGYDTYTTVKFITTYTKENKQLLEEADIVSYTEDEAGDEIKNVDFDQFVYYEAVKCNRRDAGDIADWQDGVASYEEWGCGDITDLNADLEGVEKKGFCSYNGRKRYDQKPNLA